MHIHILLPFPGSAKEALTWANEERFIDFRRERERAARCTMSFAALELKTHLEQSGHRVTVSDAQVPADATIRLEARSLLTDGEEYDATVQGSTLTICGQGRIGVLYGAYDFLKRQGWRWYEPGDVGEYSPEDAGTLVLEPMQFHPQANIGRGMVFENPSQDSADLWLWMARNKLNLGGYRPMTGALLHKLGIQGDQGGHIFEPILDPNREMPSGKTLWEEHPEWYGTPATGEKTRDRALRTQFCVSQPDLMDFLSEEVLNYATGEWQDADILNLDVFDTWGNSCNCPACRKLGNGSDKYLHFLSAVRDRLNEAQETGRMDHSVKLCMCIYEGTATFLPPENPIPQNLLDAGDFARIAVINRCYRHNFDDPACDWNSHYNETLKAWLAKDNMLPIIILEYYNVSKFEDLPLLFNGTLSNDVPYYQSIGARGFTYMHPPMVNWAMRSLTQSLYAALASDPQADADGLIAEYYQRRFGEYAPEVRKAYELIENAWLTCANWRSWDARSILSLLQSWDGRKPETPLTQGSHFPTMGSVVADGQAASQKLAQALKILEALRRQEKIQVARKAPSVMVGGVAPVNPVELMKMQNASKREICIGEDIRLLRYGLDVMSLMAQAVAYYDALYREDAQAADACWQQIEELEERTEGYYIPINHNMRKVCMVSRDALSRAQLREVIRRCRKYRLELA